MTYSPCIRADRTDILSDSIRSILGRVPTDALGLAIVSLNKDSEKEQFGAVSGCGKESVIVFRAVENTNWQVTDGKYYAGYRAGYTLYEIFYKAPLEAEADSTFLAVPEKRDLPAELIDEQQKIWFPVFVGETKGTESAGRTRDSIILSHSKKWGVPREHL